MNQKRAAFTKKVNVPKVKMFIGNVSIFRTGFTIRLKKPKIIVDTREKQSLVASELVHNGCEIKFEQLKVGDYIVKNTLIERKTVSDFIGSMLNGRLRKQLKNMQKVENKIHPLQI